MSPFSEAIKRTFDIVASALGLLVVSPVLFVTAIFVKLDSSGPVFYRGVRSGRNGKTFRIIKFRTMVVDAESKGGTTTGLNDARLTGVGKFLRTKKLDEIPQLINVLKGEMSLVGPRPEVNEYASRYSDEELKVLTVRPGITDLASLEFIRLDQHVGTEDPDGTYRRDVLPRKNRLRMEYVDRQSLGLDLAILCRTVLSVGRSFLKRDA